MDIMNALIKVTVEIRDWANTKLLKKVDKVDGKGLSTNDYTDEEQQKLDDLPSKEDVVIFDCGTAEFL